MSLFWIPAIVSGAFALPLLMALLEPKPEERADGTAAGLDVREGLAPAPRV